jgi:hypothetical protein
MVNLSATTCHWFGDRCFADPVGFANSGGLVFVDESAEEISTL